MAVMELPRAGTLFCQNFQILHVNIGDCRFCLSKIIDIYQYLLTLLENIAALVVFEPRCSLIWKKQNTSTCTRIFLPHIHVSQEKHCGTHEHFQLMTAVINKLHELK